MEEWEKTARKLPCGRSIRVKCCRKDRSQVISHTPKGYSTYCFRCGDDSRQFIPHGVRPLGELIKQQEALDAYIRSSGTCALPDDYKIADDTMPREAWLWLLKSGVSSSLARHYKFGYSESLGRVVLPVWDRQERLVAVQNRAIHSSQKPKYLNIKGGGSHAVFESDDATFIENPITDTLVITEDILSTVRAGRVCPAISTLGTTLHYSVASSILLQPYTRVLIWYDGDEAGVRGAIKAKKVLTLLGIPCSVIDTDKDPKEYNNEEIREIIQTVLSRTDVPGG